MEHRQPLSPLQTSGPFHHSRASSDFSSPRLGAGDLSSGHLPIPHMTGQGRAGGHLGAQLSAARSPPKQKSTSHVPCRFFPIGQCQAGSACQFSHDLDPMTQNAPCKYFARGSCKFGQGCALIHVLPDGRVVNRPARGGQAFGRRRPPNVHLYSGNLVSTLAMNQPDSSSNLDPSALQTQDLSAAYTHQPTSPLFRTDLYGGEASPTFGSPQNDYLGQMRLSQRTGLTARDAPMPSSWDSQGVSLAARNGPYAASMPGRFGLESPPSSYPNKAQLGNTALRDRDSAYGDTANLDGVLHGLGSSPREGNDVLSFQKRPLHSERFARTRPFLSSSLDVRNSQYLIESSNSEPDAGDSDDGAGEDLLPSSLHDLLPTDRTRRTSRGGPLDDDGPSTWSSSRRAVSGGISAEQKIGSLSPQSSSPSRYSAMWAARSASRTETDSSPSSAFGHVGSPLRPSNLRTSSSSGLRQPPSNGTSTSMLTSQLQRAKLGEAGPISYSRALASPTSAPSAASASARTVSNGRPSLSQAERTASGSYSNALGRDKIEEESIFSMEEETGGLDNSEAEPGVPQSTVPIPASGPWTNGNNAVGIIGSQRAK